jgi:hypothetical protein
MKKLLTSILILAASITTGWSQASQHSAAKAKKTWVLVITPQSTKHTLDSVIMAWEKQNVDLQFSKLKYDASGKLVEIKGFVSIKANGTFANATFGSKSLESFEIKVNDGPGVSVKGQ